MSDIVQKLWGFCHTLRHDGVDYGDYIEQITYLLFLKMADERGVEVPEGCSWPTIKKRSGTEWIALGMDVKAAAYEGLLEKAASEGKKGAGQYFTPRVLIQAIVKCLRPDPRERPDFTICDPAVGTGGFLVAAYEWFAAETKGALDRSVAKRVKTKTYFGEELVERPRRLALMNLFLHGIEPHIRLGDSIYEPPSQDPFDVILTH